MAWLEEEEAKIVRKLEVGLQLASAREAFIPGNMEIAQVLASVGLFRQDQVAKNAPVH